MQSSLKYVGKGKPPPADARLPFSVAEYRAAPGGRAYFTLIDADGRAFEFGDHPTHGAALRVASHYNEFHRLIDPVVPWARRALTDAERARHKAVTDLFLRPAGPGASIR